MSISFEKKTKHPYGVPYNLLIISIPPAVLPCYILKGTIIKPFNHSTKTILP